MLLQGLDEIGRTLLHEPAHRRVRAGAPVKQFSLAVLPGDGIGPEVTAEAVKVLRAAADLFGYRIAHRRSTRSGRRAWPSRAMRCPTRTRGARDSRRTPSCWVRSAIRRSPRRKGGGGPEAGLLALRKLLGAYANLRPVVVHPSLEHASPLRPERLDGVDLLIVRELTGGLYYGEPRGRERRQRGQYPPVHRGRDRAGRAGGVPRGAGAAGPVDVGGQGERAGGLPALAGNGDAASAGMSFRESRLEHLYVDFAAMRLVADPARIDVLLTENLFGDILSDEAAVLTGSLGLLPSASLGDGPGLFEPVHGSAPDIAGRGIANPIGAIACAAMLLRYGLGIARGGRGGGPGGRRGAGGGRPDRRHRPVRGADAGDP